MTTAKEELKKLSAEEKGCVDFPSMVFNYGCYHKNPVNKLIHAFGIPLIVFCIMIMLAHLGHTEVFMGLVDRLPLPLHPIPNLEIDKYNLVLTTAYVVLTTIYYIADIGVGIVWTMWSLP